MKITKLTISVIVILASLLVSSVSLGNRFTVSAQNSKKFFIYFKSFPTSNDLENIKGIGSQIRFTYRDMPVISAQIPIPKIETLLKNPNIQKVEEIGIVRILGKPIETRGVSPHDPQQIPWGIAKINAPQAWPQSKGAGVNIAILDTGIDTTHPDLIGNIAWCKSESVAPSCKDRNGHGTHVAGTIAALDNSIGVVGVAPDAKLYALQVCDAAGHCYIDALTKGVEDARYGPDGVLGSGDESRVISMSLGGPSPLGTAFETQISNAYSEGIVLVAAAGNDGTDSIDYPARYSQVIAVGATDQNDNRASFSDYGSGLELVAPGVSILSTYKNGGYATGSGTSMSVPHVSGIIALMLATAPDVYDLNNDSQWSPDEIRNKLHAQASDLGDFAWDSYYGHGLVNALSAVTFSALVKINSGNALWSTERAYRGSNSVKLTTVNGQTDVGIIEIKVDIPLNEINSLSFWKFVSSFTTDNWCSCGWNPNILLGIDNDGDGIYETEDFAWKDSYPSYNPALLHGDSFVQGEANFGLTSFDTSWLQIDGFSYYWYSPNIAGTGYGLHYGPLTDYQTGSIEGINPSAKVKVIKIYIGEAGSWTNEAAFVDNVIVNGHTLFN